MGEALGMRLEFGLDGVDRLPGLEPLGALAVEPSRLRLVGLAAGSLRVRLRAARGLLRLRSIGMMLLGRCGGSECRERVVEIDLALAVERLDLAQLGLALP